MHRGAAAGAAQSHPRDQAQHACQGQRIERTRAAHRGLQAALLVDRIRNAIAVEVATAFAAVRERIIVAVEIE